MKKTIKNHFGSIIKNVSDVVAILDADGVIRNVNPAARRTLGYSSKQLLGKNVAELIHPDDLPAALEAFQHRLDHPHAPTGYFMEVRIRHKNGQWRNFEGMGNNLLDDPTVNGIVLLARDVTERRQQEQALRESEQYNRMLFDSFPIGLALCRMDGSLVDVNPAYAGIIGRTVEETLKLTNWDITPKEYADQEAQQLQSLEATGRYGPYEKEYIHKDGRRVPVRLTGSIVERNGERFNWSSVEDITERKRTEQALHDREARLVKAQQVARMGFLDWNLKTNELECSDEIYRMYGVGREEGPTTPVFIAKVVHPDDLEFVQKNLELAMQGVKKYDIDHRIQRPDGEVLWVHAQAELTRDAKGNPDTLLGTIVDITERKRAEVALSISEEKFFKAFRSSPDSITISSLAEGKLIEVNDGFERLFGYSREEALGCSTLELNLYTDPEDRRRFVQLLRKNGRVQNLELTGRHKSGDNLIAQLSAEVMDIGNQQYLVTIVRDITARKQAEAEIRQRAEELAALNALGRAVSATLSLENTSTAAVKEILEAVHADLAFLFLREGEKLILKGLSSKKAGKRLGAIPEHRVGECMCGLAVTQGKPLYSRDISTDIRCTLDECKKAGFCSFAALPLRCGTEIIGVVGLAAETERDFEPQAGYLEMLASQVASGIRNAQLYGQAQQRLNELDTIHQAAQRLQILHTPEALAQILIRILEENLDYEYGAIVLLDEHSDTLVPFALSEQGRGAEFGEMDKASVASQRLQVGKGITGWVAQTGQSVCLGDVRKDPRYQSIHAGIRSELCVPLCVGNVVIGVINTETSKPDAYTEDDQRVLETIAAQIVVAIQNARLLEQVQRHAAELEQHVAERTAELQAVNKELETFAYTVSHDLKAPLRGIDGYSRLLLEDHAGKLDEEGRQFLVNIRHAAEQMNDLIEDLLQYSRLERRAVTSGKVNLRALIEAILTERADEILSRRVRVSKRISCESVTADPEGLNMALRNLIDNALKFTANVPEPRIEIVGRATEKACIIEVHDNGVGFDKQYREHIFEIFQRLRRAEEYPGTGVGLAIVRKAMERMGGRAWAESAPGEGATFYLEIPI